MVPHGEGHPEAEWCLRAWALGSVGRSSFFIPQNLGTIVLNKAMPGFFTTLQTL